MITDLRNPCLKARHWEMLEEIVEAKLLEEPLTLAFLQELNIFNFGPQIQEVRETLRLSKPTDLLSWTTFLGIVDTFQISITFCH